MSHSSSAIFCKFLKLGTYCFGGPIAHYGYFYQEFVLKSGWIDEKVYMDLVVLCQGLPGATSSQVAIAIGMRQSGLLGGIAALCGFALPSILILILAAYGLHFFNPDSTWLHGLKIAALVVIFQAIIQMAMRFCTTRISIIVALIAAILSSFITGFTGQIVAIAIGASFGAFFIEPLDNAPVFQKDISTPIPKIAWLLFFFFLMPFGSIFCVPYLIDLFTSFYQVGALVFGGGHVVLPLLQTKTVDAGLIDLNAFLAGYGLAQAIPGPLFSFAAFLGTIILESWLGGLFCVSAIYLPSFLILLAVLPIWDSWRHLALSQTIFAGISASMVGLLLSAFYNPVWKSTITSIQDVILALIAFLLLTYFQWPQWLIVILCSMAAYIVL